MKKTLALILMLTLLMFVSLSCSVKIKDKYEGFPQPKADFQAHVSEVKKYLLATQLPERSPGDVEYNLPFEKKSKLGIPYRGRFMLIHGLNDSPYVLSDVVTELTDRGFDVRAILLPGHGNTPEEQLKVSHKRWLNSARGLLNLWKKEDIPLYLGGFSMGGVISTILALEDEDIDGLLLFSPAYKSKVKYLQWSWLYSLYKPWIFGKMIIEDNPTKYNSIPVNGGAQYYNLTKVLKRKWGRKSLNIPVFMVVSGNDSVVDVDFTTLLFNQHFTSEKKRMLIYSNEKDVKSTVTMDYRASAYPDLRIIN
jgi:esterase/lipase